MKIYQKPFTSGAISRLGFPPSQFICDDCQIPFESHGNEQEAEIVRLNENLDRLAETYALNIEVVQEQRAKQEVSE